MDYRREGFTLQMRARLSGLFSAVSHGCKAVHLDLDNVRLDVFGVKGPAIPFGEMVVFRVLRVGECLKEDLKAGNAADRERHQRQRDTVCWSCVPARTKGE